MCCYKCGWLPAREAVRESERGEHRGRWAWGGVNGTAKPSQVVAIMEAT